MGPLCRGPGWMPITPKRGPFCTPRFTAVPMATHSPHDGYPAVAPTRAVQKEIEGIRKSCPDNGAKERKSKQIKSSSFRAVMPAAEPYSSQRDFIQSLQGVVHCLLAHTL